MKNKILSLFYEERLSQKEITEKLKISKGYVSRIVTNDDRYAEFKRQKLENSKKRHNKKIQELTKEKRKQIQFNYAVDDLGMRNIHTQASMELSEPKHLSNENYRKWNISAYKYNKSKKRYEFNSKLGRSADVPKYIKER